MQSSQKFLILAIVLMVCLTVIYLNFQHSSNCTGNNSNDEDVKMYLESLNKRLLKAETQVILILNYYYYYFYSFLLLNII